MTRITLATRVISGVPTLIWKEDGRIYVQGIYADGEPVNEIWDADTDGIIAVHKQAALMRSGVLQPRPGILRRVWAALKGGGE